MTESSQSNDDLENLSDDSQEISKQLVEHFK